MSTKKFIVKDDWSGYFDQYSVQSPSSEVKEVKKEQKNVKQPVVSEGPNYFDAAPEVSVCQRRKFMDMSAPVFERENTQDYLDGQEKIVKQMEDFINAECPTWVGGEDDGVCVDVHVDAEPETAVSVPMEDVVCEPVAPVEVEERTPEVVETVEAEHKPEDAVETEVHVKSTLRDLQGFIFELTVRTDDIEDVDITFKDGVVYEDIINEIEILPISGNEKIDEAIAILEKYDNTDYVSNVCIKYKDNAVVEPVAELSPVKPRKTVSKSSGEKKSVKTAKSTAVKKTVKSPAKKK